MATTGHMAGVGGRTFWSVADQAASSLTNFGITFIVARLLGPFELGLFALAFSAYMLAVGVERATVGEPLVMRYSDKNDDELRNSMSLAAGAALLEGGVFAAVALLLTVVLDPSLATAVRAFACVLPGLLLQDAWRYSFVSAGRPRSAFVNDVVWGGLSGGFVLIAIARDQRNLTSLVMAWGIAGTIAGIIGCFQAHAVPAPHRAGIWIRRHVDIAPVMSLEYFIQTAAAQAPFVVLASVGTVAQTGAFRAGRLLFSPVVTIHRGIRLMGISEVVRMRDRQTSEVIARLLLASIALAVLPLVLGAAIIAVPDSIGMALLNDSWRPARELVFPVMTMTAAAAFQTVAEIGLRAMMSVKKSLRSRIIELMITVSAAWIGLSTAGLIGAAWALSAAFCVEAAVWWHALVRDMRARRVDSPLDARIETA